MAAQLLVVCALVCIGGFLGHYLWRVALDYQGLIYGHVVSSGDACGRDPLHQSLCRAIRPRRNRQLPSVWGLSAAVRLLPYALGTLLAVTYTGLYVRLGIGILLFALCWALAVLVPTH